MMSDAAARRRCRVSCSRSARVLREQLAPHIPSAEGFHDDLDAWTGVAFSHEGLKALGVPEATLKTFPLAFQQGMAARAEILRDFGENAPETGTRRSRASNATSR